MLVGHSPAPDDLTVIAQSKASLRSVGEMNLKFSEPARFANAALRIPHRPARAISLTKFRSAGKNARTLAICRIAETTLSPTPLTREMFGQEKP